MEELTDFGRFECWYDVLAYAVVLQQGFCKHSGEFLDVWRWQGLCSQRGYGVCGRVRRWMCLRFWAISSQANYEDSEVSLKRGQNAVNVV